VVTETDLHLPDGRKAHVYDSGGDLALFWHHGSPQTGALPPPLLASAAERGIRLLSYDRPGYNGTPDRPGRDVASAAVEVAAIADALGIDRFAVIGHSGGGPHALACGGLLPSRVLAVISMSGLAPFSADRPWFAGMAPAGEAELRAAVAGREALETHLVSTPFDEDLFTEADHAALSGAWAPLGNLAELAMSSGLGGLVDDDLAFVRPWGFSTDDVVAPVLLVHGLDDRVVPAAHSSWLADHLARSELRLTPGDGHISVLGHLGAALDWLVDVRDAARG
jgi:pimeloyl-ACP methyl ester carboxylesterase